VYAIPVYVYRFYPGVAAPARPALGAGAGWAADAEAVHEPPASEMEMGSPATMDARASATERYRPANVRGGAAADADPTAERRGRGVRTPGAGRAPRVTGSFDHALLPMPPVSWGSSVCAGGGGIN
jgi:hypothetical protein